MKQLVTFFLFGLLLPTARTAQAQEYFQQFVHYTIQVRLDPQKHMLIGNETIFYVNNSPDTLRQFYLHLYPNAYQSKNTAFMQDVQRSVNYSLFDVPDRYRGYLKISDVKIDGAAVNADIDDTIASLTLPEPLLPGGRIEIELQFEEKVRRHIGRAGYRGQHYDLAQWYPKVVVYDENGFHTDKFQAGEFYGEFGTFDVFIEVPEHYVIAATGVLKDGDPGWHLNPVAGGGASKNVDKNAYKTAHFHAEDVHDFAWSVDPSFVVQDTTWNDIEIRSFYRKHNSKAWKDTTLAHGVRAIQWLSEKVGPYPYPQVSIVDALLRGGMEYPMLVMDSRADEGLVVHEVGHIYFYGIFGNDERAEAWLDEGFTTFQTNWYMKNRYGPHGATQDWNWYQRITPQHTRDENLRQRVFPLFRLNYDERIATRSEQFTGTYYPMVYQKAALMYEALRYVVSAETFDRILHEYFDRWKLKHVNEARFQQVCEDVSGMELDWFFEEWLHTRKKSDYRLHADTHASESGGGYTTAVKIERKGEIVMPLVLEFTFADGRTETSKLEGRLRTIEKDFEFPEKPVAIALNPRNEIMDTDLSDNFVPRRRAYRFDWPNNRVTAEDAYTIKGRPEAWFNDIDGLKAGVRLSGSYDNWSRRKTLGLYYGAKSGRIDFSASWARPFRFFGGNNLMSASGYKMEGRQDATFQLSYRKRPVLIRPPTQTFRAGWNYHQLTNSRFIANPETYQEEPDFAPFFLYSADPQLDVLRTRINVGLRFGREWFGGDYKYSRFTVSGTAKSRGTLVPVDLRARVFIGVASGSLPFQQKFSLAGGGPLAEERRFWLRSPGAIWNDANYHEGGGGNLRGYLDGSFGVNRLVAANLELGHSIPLLSKRPGAWWGSIKAMAFIDGAWIYDGDNPIGNSPRVQALVDGGILDETLVDAGVGFRFHRNFPFYDLHFRFDIPFYVNHPEINGETSETEYRYVLSLASPF